MNSKWIVGGALLAALAWYLYRKGSEVASPPLPPLDPNPYDDPVVGLDSGEAPYLYTYEPETSHHLNLPSTDYTDSRDLILANQSTTVLGRIPSPLARENASTGLYPAVAGGELPPMPTEYPIADQGLQERVSLYLVPRVAAKTTTVLE